MFSTNVRVSYPNILISVIVLIVLRRTKVENAPNKKAEKITRYVCILFEVFIIIHYFVILISPFISIVR